MQMAQTKNQYPKQVITTERINSTSEGYQIITNVSNESEEEAIKTAIAYMDAFNEADVTTTDSFINFPYASVGEDGVLVVNEKAGTLWSPHYFADLRKRYGWSHSCWDSRTVIQSSGSKVHLMVTFSRYRADGSKIGTFTAIWVMTRQNNHWGIKMRSTFSR
jgi:hypothetical protein